MMTEPYITHILLVCIVSRRNQMLAHNSLVWFAGPPHRFDECKILANTEFLRGHYIRFCQQMKREAASRASAFNNNGGSSNNTNSQEQSNVNFLDTQQEISPSVSYPPSSRQAQSNAYDSSDSEEDMDFH
jgi:hypothetical protein